MKFTRSCILVVSIILITLLFTACIQIIPQTKDEPADVSEKSEETEEDTISDEPKKTDTPLPEPTDSPTGKPQPDSFPDPIVAEMFINEPIWVDFFGDGTTTELELTYTDDALAFHSTQSGYTHSLTLANIPAGYVTNAYYVRSYDGYPFVIVSYDYCSDDYETQVLTFSGFEPDEILRLPLYVTQIDENRFDAYGYIEAAGTWAVATSAYFVMDTIEWRGIYELDQSSSSYITAIVAKDLPVFLWENGEYQEYTLTPDVTMDFVATDGQTYMQFILWDGTEGYFNFELDSDWIGIIDGIPVFDYFVDLPSFG